MRVTSSILLNLSKGVLLPVGVEVLGHAIHDPFGRLGIGEHAHGACPLAHLPEGPLQDVGGPELLREAEVVETVEQVLLQAADRRFGLIEPLRAPGPEPADRLGSGGGAEDEPRPCRLRAGPASASRPSPSQTPALEINQESLPTRGVLPVSQAEREEFLRPVGVDPERAEHDLAFDAQLADLLADPIEEQEHDIISQRLSLSLRDRGGAHRDAEEVPGGDRLELPGADALQEELADSRIDRRLAALVLVEQGELHTAFQEPGDAQLREGAVGRHEVAGVVPFRWPWRPRVRS